MSEDNNKAEIKIEHLLHKCKCDNVAIWYYAPSGPGERYYCEDCVPRGCSCNYRYVNVDAYYLPLDNQIYHHQKMNHTSGSKKTRSGVESMKKADNHHVQNTGTMKMTLKLMINVFIFTKFLTMLLLETT